MRRVRKILLAVVTGGLSLGAGIGEAADADLAISVLPVRYSFVDGDAEKFRAHHWMKDGYVGGLEDFSAHFTMPDGTTVSSEAHALIDQNDLGASLSIKKDRLGFVDLDFAEFRKYYDGTGGVHRRFSTLQVNETDKALALDLGKLELETGLTLEGWPALTFLYEREFKDGAKSRLTWTAVKEAAETRNIGPAWQDIDEIVDTFALQTTHELAGFSLKGEQRWEFVRTETFREERNLSTTGAAADQKIRRQDQAPEATLMTTTLEGQRWFLNDKAFFDSAYRFAHMDTREFESLLEFDENGNPRSFANPKNKPNARADNDYDTHTWVGSVLVMPWDWLSLSSKLKSEVMKRESNSTYPSETTDPPDGTINTTELSLTDNHAVRWGEALSLRFTGIPRTALYTELELEQTRILMREDRRSLAGQSASDANEAFNRETVTDVRRGAWTLGGQAAPSPALNLTAHVRHRRNNNDYDDQRESAPGSSTARSAFIDEQNVHTNEFATRATLRPCRWFRSSFRYQLREDDYFTRVEAEPVVETGARSHIYTLDVSLQPWRELTTTASFSRQNAATTTPARLASSANTPTFNADVSTWLLSTDYTPKPNVTLTNTLLYSRADNFNDFAGAGLPLGADFYRWDVTTGLKWALTEQTSIGADYAFYTYNPNENVESGEYHAHLLWLEGSLKF